MKSVGAAAIGECTKEYNATLSALNPSMACRIAVAIGEDGDLVSPPTSRIAASLPPLPANP